MKSAERSVPHLTRTVVEDRPKVTPRLTKKLRPFNKRNQLQDSLDIFQLDVVALEALLKDPKFQELGRSDSPTAQLFSACFARLTEIDPEKALMVADSLDFQHKYIALDSIYKEWAASDPDAALASTLQLKNTRHQKMALRHTLLSIAVDDPSRAFELSQEHGKSHPTLYSSIYGIISKMTDQDPLLALKAIEDSSNKPSRKEGFTKSVLATWARNDPDAVSSYVDQVSNDSQRAVLTKNLIGVFSYVEPDRSLALLESNMGTYGMDDLRGVIMNLAGENPNRLIAWIDSSYEGAHREEMILSAISSWSSNDGEGLNRYYDSLPESELKEKAHKSLEARQRRGGLSATDEHFRRNRNR